MKRLVLLRHAKSDWGADYGRDHDRPLSRRGRQAAPAMGRFLVAAGWTPDRVVSSSAMRARTTAELASEAGGWEAETVLDPGLYGASVAAAVRCAAEQDDSIETLLLVGHEPTWSAAVTTLIGGGSVRMPTAAAAGLLFPGESWREVGPGRGELRFLVPPRALSGR